MKSAGSFWADARRWLPGLVLSGIAIYAISRLVSFKDLGDAFSSIRLIYLVPAVFLVLLWLGLRALALRFILAGKATLIQTFHAINIGYLLNNILPLRAGEFGKAAVLGKSSELGTSYVLSSIVLERAFDLFFAATFLLGVLPMVLEMSWTRSVAIIVLALVVGGFAALYLMVRQRENVQEYIARVGQKWSWVHRFIEPYLTSFLRGFSVLTDLRMFLLCFLCIGSSWIVGVVLYYLMLFSITIHPQVWWGIFVNSILAMGIAIPSAPAALGVFEASVVAALKILGIEYSQALAYAVIMHFIQFAITCILGFHALTRERQSVNALFSLSKKRMPEGENEINPSEITK